MEETRAVRHSQAQGQGEAAVVSAGGRKSRQGKWKRPEFATGLGPWESWRKHLAFQTV